MSSKPTVAQTAFDERYLKACCADLWSHPGVRILAGDALHPGGPALTDRVLDLLDLPTGGRVLDVGTGPGLTRDLAMARGLRPVGVDLSPAFLHEARGGTVAGADAERLPFAPTSFDGALAECVVSVIPDKARALAEFRRVVKPRGAVAICDVTADGPLPDEIRTLVGWIACAAGALSAEGYLQLLEQAGFGSFFVEDHRGALELMIAQARRRLSLIQGASRAGIVDVDQAGIPDAMLEVGQRLLGVAAEAVRSEILGYTLIVAQA
jgi:arsenite methyltransferase